MKRKRDELWEAAVEECYPSGVATSMRKEVNGLVRDLKDLNATPAEIHRRARLYWQYCEKKDLMYGLRGLVRRWDQFPPPKPKRKTRDDLDAEERTREEAAMMRRKKLAQQIVARHTDAECVDAWDDYLSTLGNKACFAGKRERWPVAVANRLEPGELDRMMSK